MLDYLSRNRYRDGIQKTTKQTTFETKTSGKVPTPLARGAPEKVAPTLSVDELFERELSKCDENISQIRENILTKVQALPRSLK